MSDSAQAEILAVVYTLAFWVISVLIIIGGAVAAHIFATGIKSARASTRWDQRARVLHGWIVFAIVRNLATLNLVFYAIFDPSEDSVRGKIIKDNLPAHTAEFILVLCILLALPTLATIWRAFVESADITKATLFSNDDART